jgi:hypothetical protein
MRTGLKSAASGLALATLLNSAALAQGLNDAEFQTTITTLQNQTFSVDVDCDTLGNERILTAAFIKQFGVWGHIKNETNPQRAIMHLRLHGITPEPIREAAVECFDNYR